MFSFLNLFRPAQSYVIRCQAPAALAVREAIREKWTSILALFSVAVSTMVIALLISISHVSPYLYFATAVQSSGEIDLSMKFDLAVQRNFVSKDFISLSSGDAFGGLNATASLQSSSCERLQGIPLFNNMFPSLVARGDICAPRMENIPITLVNPINCDTGLSSEASDSAIRKLNISNCDALSTYPYTGACKKDSSDVSSLCYKQSDCLNKLCGTSFASHQGSFYLIDSPSENAAAIAGRWNRQYPEIPPASIVISSKLAASAAILPGDKVFARVSLSSLFPNIDITLYGQETYPYLSVVVQLTVLDVIPDALGKIGDSSDLWAFCELRYFYELVTKSLHPDAMISFNFFISNTNLTLNNLICSIDTDRPQPYSGSSFPGIAKSVLQWASVLALRIAPLSKPGANSTNDEFANMMSTSQLPILSNLQNLFQFSNYVYMLLTLVIIFISALCIYLIYCLITVSVESRQYDFCVLRMVGMPSFEICVHVYAQAFFYAIPGLAVGLIIAQGAFVLFKNSLEKLLFVPIAWPLTGWSVGISIAIAIVIPIFSALVPVRRVTAFNIRDVLEGVNSVSPLNRELITQSSNAENGALVTLGGTLIVSLGFVTYYCLPYALVRGDTSLLFNIFLLILISILCAMVVLLQNIIPGLQRLMARLLFLLVSLFETPVLYSLIMSNIVVHRARTEKTSMLYALAFSIIICLNVSADMQISALQLSVQQALAADIVVSSDSYLTSGFPYPIANVQGLENYASSSPYVRLFAWSSYNLKSTHPNITSTIISNLGNLVSMEQNVYAVTPSFFDICNPMFLQTSNFDINVAQYSPGEQLYSSAANGSASVLGSALSSYFALDEQPENPLTGLFNLKTFRKDGSTSVVRMNPVFFASSTPNFYMISNTALKSAMGDILITMSQFVDFSKKIYSSYSQIPMSRFFVSLVPGITDKEFSYVLNNITMLTNFETVTNIRSMLKSSNTAAHSLSTVFTVSTGLILIILYFSLSTSMQVAIKEQRREIGILRALGLSRFAVYRLYFYEAFLLLLGSMIVGLSIGVVMGWAMTAQQSLLTNLPAHFSFPWTLLLIICSCSFISALLSIFFPVRNIVTRESLISVLKE